MSPVACPNCQRDVPEPDTDCPICGPTGSEGTAAPPTDRTESRGFRSDAIAALLLAVASVYVWPLAIFAVVYGLAVLRTPRQQRDRNQPVDPGRWMAIEAVAISVLAVPLVIYGVVFV